MDSLSRMTAPGIVAGRDGSSLPVKVLQFGEGNFLRAFAGWMLDSLNGQGLFNGSILALNNTRRGGVEALKSQDCLFTVVSRGLSGGCKVDVRRVVSSVSKALNPYSEWAALLDAARSPELRFVISNTTEAGIVYKPEAFISGAAPETFPAKCAALLAERASAFSFDNSKGGLLFLPCELIERNGAALRAAVLRHLSDWGMLREAAWVGASCVFANTLVDRIVPGRPSQAELAKLSVELGFTDKLLVTAEPFHFWAIEAPESVWDSIPFAAGGLNVVWTKDLAPYRTRKVRLLNAAHTANVLSAYLGGVDTVLEMMEHPLFGKLARKSLYEELLPTVPMPEAERKAYADSVVERFMNPFIRHELISISLNSVSKWKVRVLPSLVETVEAGRGVPPCLAFSLAALAAFYRGVPNAAGDALQASRRKGPYHVKDEPAVLRLFLSAWAAAGDDAAKLAVRILPEQSLWGRDLTAIPGLRVRFERDLSNILSLGTAEAARLAAGV